MTGTPPSHVRVLAFGDLEGTVWGTVIDAGATAIVFCTPDGVGSGTVALERRSGRLDRQRRGCRVARDPDRA